MRYAIILLAWLAAPAYAEEQPDPLLSRSVSDEALEEQRGGAALKLNVMDLEARQTDNVARDTVSGANVVAEGAFSNASGLATVIQNSGNNVVIQNATIVNLEMK